MDQIETKHTILNEVILTNNEKKKVARRRWAILAKALKSPVGSEPSSPTDEFSVRRISSFMLLKTHEIQKPIINTTNQHVLDQINKRTWYKYKIEIDNKNFELNIGHRTRTFSAEDLMGFNNTGNICIWPSEETLSYYICANLLEFNNKTIIELGGGMSCLAGLFVAKYGNPKTVLVTDGNKLSVDNVQAALYCNEFQCSVKCKVLKWCKIDNNEQQQQYDYVLCADCLFFDDYRNDLIECIWSLLKLNGICLIMAPKRGDTLNNFLIKSKEKGFNCLIKLNYNQCVWDRHLCLLNNCDYNDNIHYPILIEMTKTK